MALSKSQQHGTVFVIRNVMIRDDSPAIIISAISRNTS